MSSQADRDAEGKLEYRKLVDIMSSELKKVKGEIRSEIILLQSHVEFMIDEIFELIFETDALRGTKARLDLKLQVLQDLKWFHKDTVYDVKKLAMIRGWVAHKIQPGNSKNMKKIEDEFRKMILVKKYEKDFFPKDDPILDNVNRVSQIYIRLFWDIYQEVFKMKEKSSLKKHFDA